jgi:lantibiotic modifying enzyme
MSRRTGRAGGDHALAIALGEYLCLKALRQGALWCWDPAIATGPGTASTPLTGLSHGASGMGLALMELYATTGRSDFLEAGRGAFAYEDSLFNPTLGNWPDLRHDDPCGIASRTPRYARAWCHGAPGIALARLRASALDPTRAETHLTMARAAITTTLQAIDQRLGLPSRDASLCHGLAGLMEVVLIAGRTWDDPGCLAQADAAVRFLIDRHACQGDWPSGVASAGPNPSLMLGLAGTGYAFLRLEDPQQVPPILLLDA